MIIKRNKDRKPEKEIDEVVNEAFRKTGFPLSSGRSKKSSQALALFRCFEPISDKDAGLIAGSYQVKDTKYTPVKSSLSQDVGFIEELSINEVTLGEASTREAFAEEVAVVEEPLFNQIEGAVKDAWRYIVMQLGGVFLNEIRPSKCLTKNNKILADELIGFKNKRYSLKTQKLEEYLAANSNGNLVQVHFSDIMYDPKVNDYGVFSITSGSIEKANIFLDLARFLQKFNRGEKTVLPVHLPYYEKFRTNKRAVIEFGELSENGKRDALFNTERVLRYLVENWRTESGKALNVNLALETGSGEVKKGVGGYALLYQPEFFKILTRGRESIVSVCEDIGHLNLVNEAECDWKNFLRQPVSEIHVSANDGKRDQHILPTQENLKDYELIVSFLKFYSGYICIEVGRGELSPERFLEGIRDLAHIIFSKPSNLDYVNLGKIEYYLETTFRGTEDFRIHEKNLNERYTKRA